MVTSLLALKYCQANRAIGKASSANSFANPSPVRAKSRNCFDVVKRECASAAAAAHIGLAHRPLAENGVRSEWRSSRSGCR
jgi:hypothetical protein